jgi:predicted TIM-barrel fold metal-dependent hydrolase
MIIEWNEHMFSSDTERYPFHPNAVYHPKTDTMAEDPLAVYLKRMEEAGIDRAILVHPEPYGDDHRLVLACQEREPERVRITSLFYPKDPDAVAKLTDLVARQPKVISTRFHAHKGKEQYLDSFSDANVVAIWEKAIDLGLIVELHIGPDYGCQVRDIIADHPETVVLIDHLAEPHKGDPIEFSDILDLAEFDHVYMKLSGLNHFKKDAPLYESAKPFTKRVVEAFGPDRLVWGSGTPEIVDAHMEGYSEADRAKVKGGNLVRIVPWSID